MLKTPCAMDASGDNRRSAGVSGSSGTLAQEMANGYIKNRGFDPAPLLPTPITRDWKGGSAAPRKDNGKLRTDSLDSMVSLGMLPTPQSTDCKEPLSPEAKAKHIAKWMKKGIMPSGAYQLRQQAAEGLLPTPQARDNKNPSSPDGKRIARKLEQGWTIDLSDLVVMEGQLPTPSARDWKGKTNPGTVKEGSGCVYGETLPDTLSRLTKDSSPKTAGGAFRLSPLFTEEMMGFPFLWTTLPVLRENGEKNQ